MNGLNRLFHLYSRMTPGNENSWPLIRVILNHINFPQLVRSLNESLAARNSKKGRDHLMWMLLQYISGSIQKTPLTDFLPFFKLHDLLYPEKDPLPVPDITKPICTHTFAISSIWTHLLKKAENEPQKMIRPIPNCLRLHVEFLHQSFMSSDLPATYKILDRIGAKALSSHLRILVDYLVNEFTNLCGTQNVTKYIDKLNDFIWKSAVITQDRLLLYLPFIFCILIICIYLICLQTLRAYEGNEAQVSLFIIQMLLLKTTDFSNRVADFVREMSPEHWKQSNWHEKHHALHRKYPEKFYFEGLADISGQNMQHSYLPTYFSNICLRFIPVLDLIIHRYLELPPGSPSPLIDSLLEKYGCLYKFHDRPLTYFIKCEKNPQFLRERVKPIIKTEEQFLFIVHIVCPFLQRLYVERTCRAMEVTSELYSFLETIDKNCTELRFMDTITDLLYHMKYHITGDSIKDDVEGKIRNLRH
uniref:Mediator of RNA polymerase II transcription subunit 23 n=1 Tax=Tetranychus urticae TaxID=32264 RepID=T1KM10_TETUR